MCVKNCEMVTLSAHFFSQVKHTVEKRNCLINDFWINEMKTRKCPYCRYLHEEKNAHLWLKKQTPHPNNLCQSVCLGVEDTRSVVNTTVSWSWQCQQEHGLTATQTVSNISTPFYCLMTLNVTDFLSCRGNGGWKAILHDCQYCSRTYQQAMGERRYIYHN